MRILILNYEFPPLGGGAGNATFYLLKEFKNYLTNDISFDVITSSTSIYRIESFSPKIRIHYLNIYKKGSLHYQSLKDLLFYSIKSYFYSKRLINKNQYDLIHAFLGVPCGFIAYLIGIPYIISLRGSDVPYSSNRFRLLDKVIFRRLSKIIWGKAIKVIANSEGMKSKASSVIPGINIDVITNGIDTDKFHTYGYLKENKKLTLISTGRLIQVKNYDILINAMKDISNLRLILIGDGNLKAYLQGLAAMNDVEVTFYGAVSHDVIPQYLSQADIFVLPSSSEGMSNSLLEAMACGLPVIITDVGGTKELFRNNGFIVEKKSSKAIKEALLKYLSNKNLITEHGIESELIAKKFDWKTIASEYFKIYSEICTRFSKSLKEY